MNKNDEFKSDDLINLRNNISSIQDVLKIPENELGEFKQYISVFIDLLKNLNKEDKSKMIEEKQLLDKNFAYFSEIVDELQR